MMSETDMAYGTNRLGSLQSSLPCKQAQGLLSLPSLISGILKHGAEQATDEATDERIEHDRSSQAHLPVSH